MSAQAFIELIGHGPEEDSSHALSFSKKSKKHLSKEERAGLKAKIFAADSLDPVQASYLAMYKHESATWGACDIDGKGTPIESPDTKTCKTHFTTVKQQIARYHIKHRKEKKTGSLNEAMRQEDAATLSDYLNGKAVYEPSSVPPNWQNKARKAMIVQTAMASMKQQGLRGNSCWQQEESGAFSRLLEVDRQVK